MTRHATTTSVRLPASLQTQLQRAVRALHKRKSWIIVHALEIYLEKLQSKSLAVEARRQSLRISKSKKGKEDADFWEEQTDTTGWK